MGALPFERDGGAHGVEQTALVDASKHEAAALHGLGALGRGPDAHRRERAADRGEVGALLGERAGVGHDAVGARLQPVVVVEPHGLVRPHQGVEGEAGLLEALAAPGVAGVEDGLLVLLGEGVDGTEQGAKAPLVVDVLLAVRGEQEVPALVEPLAREHVRGVDGGQVRAQHLGHGGPRHERALGGAPRVLEPAAGVLGVGEVHVRDDVDDPAVRLLGEALVAAAVARLHVEDRDVKPLGGDGGEAGVGVPQHEQRIRLHPGHQLVRAVDDVADALAEVRARAVEIHVRVAEPEVEEEDAVQRVVVVLARMRQQAVEVPAALLDDLGEADDLGPSADDDEEPQPAVAGEADVLGIIHHLARPPRRRCRGFQGRTARWPT